MSTRKEEAFKALQEMYASLNDSDRWGNHFFKISDSIAYPPFSDAIKIVEEEGLKLKLEGKNCDIIDSLLYVLREKELKMIKGEFEMPPLGIMPKSIWQEQRRSELAEAIQRRLEAGFEIKKEWIDEWNESAKK